MHRIKKLNSNFCRSFEGMKIRTQCSNGAVEKSKNVWLPRCGNVNEKIVGVSLLSSEQSLSLDTFVFIQQRNCYPACLQSSLATLNNQPENVTVTWSFMAARGCLIFRFWPKNSNLPSQLTWAGKKLIDRTEKTNMSQTVPKQQARNTGDKVLSAKLTKVMNVLIAFLTTYLFNAAEHVAKLREIMRRSTNRVKSGSIR